MRKNLLKLATVSSAAVMALSAGIANAAAANATTVYDVKLSSYTSTTGDAGAGLRNAALAVQAKSGWQGGTIYVDGAYTVASQVQLDELVGAATPSNQQRVWNKVRLVGSGVGASKLKKTTNGAMFYMGRTDVCRASGTNPCQYAGVYLENLGYSNMGFETTGTSWIWQIDSGAITTSQWQSIRADVRGNGGVMYVGRSNTGKGGGQYHTNSWRDTRLERHSKTSSYPMFRFVSAHNYINGNVFDTGWWHGHGHDRTPFLEMRPSGGNTPSNSGQYTNTTFRAITGEQNLGGLIHLFGGNGISMTTVVDWDGICPGYRSSIIAVNPNGSTASRSFSISGSGTIAHSNYAPVRNGARSLWVDPSTVGVSTGGSPLNQAIPKTGTGTC